MKEKRIISLLLSMAMIFSLNAGISFADEVPVEEEPVVEEQPVEQVIEEEPVVEDVPVVEEEPEPIEEVNLYPAQTFTKTTPDGKITVEVTAPEGALPQDASMRVENVNQSTVSPLVDPLVEGNIESISAVDVIFTNSNGDVIEPLTEIIVNIKTNELTAADRYQLVHIDQAYTAENIPDEKVININNTEATFATDVFSIYVIVSVTETGAIDFDQTFGSNHVVINAPDGAFAPGTEMVISSCDDKDVVNSIISKYSNNNGIELFLLDISFYKDGVEVEPALPVSVTWESGYIQGSQSEIVHVLDNGEVENVDGAINGGTVSFTTESFSPYGVVTIHQNSVPISNFTFDPASAGQGITDDIKSGNIATNAPRIEDYAFEKATISVYDETTQRYNDVEVIEVGAFILQYDDGRPDEYNVFYRTAESMQVTDMIVLLADGEKITLHYSSAPLHVTYKIIYDGVEYTLTSEQIMNKTIPDELKAVLGEDGDNVVLSGPEVIAQNQAYEYAINAQVPRGYSASTTLNNRNLGDLGANTEPTYQVSGDGTITSTGELKLKDTYTIRASTTNQTVVMNLSKRDSFSFDASYFLRTKYTGGSTTTYGDRTVSPASANARITGDGSLTAGKKTFSGDTVSWTFTTNNTENSSWWLDALEINGTSLNVPYVGAGQTISEPVVKTTELPSGTIITVSLNSVTGTGRSERRQYTVSASNAYENIVISSGNIYNSNNSTEIIPEVLENVNYQFYGYTTSDYAYAHNGLGWQNWVAGNPIAVGNNASTGNTRNYNMYGFNQANNQAMRFSLPEGYANPEIAYVTSTEGDLSSNIGGLTLGTRKSDGYYPITSQPTNNYYNFSITGLGNNNKLGLLRIRSQLMRFGVSYTSSSDGPANPENLPEFDNGGYYGDGTLQGYNVVDNKIITISKNNLKDPNNQYVFLYYTIDGDTSSTTYAPGQKIEGAAFSTFISFAKYDANKGEYVVPLVAHWARKEEVETVTVMVEFYLDGSSEPVDRSAPLQVAKGSSIYIDIDSDEMDEFMDQYNWELFYDEATSDVYESKIQEDRTFKVQCFSKFYVYRSGTGELELHTKKELLSGGSIGAYDVYSHVESTLADGLLYGGYYLDYDADTSEAISTAAKNDALYGEITPMQVSNLSNGGYEVVATGLPVYDLNTCGTTAWSNPQTSRTVSVPTAQKGDHLPTIYYVKEVPDAYLSNYSEMIYKKADKKVVNLFQMSAVDDLNYSQTGFVVEDANHNAVVVRTFIFQQESGKTSVRRADLAFDPIVNQSYLTYLDVKNKLGEDFVTTENKQFSVTPYWITPDGVQINGKTRTINMGNLEYDNVTVS